MIIPKLLLQPVCEMFNSKHPVVILADFIDWEEIEDWAMFLLGTFILLPLGVLCRPGLVEGFIRSKPLTGRIRPL
jgi:hypothetical protein